MSDKAITWGKIKVYDIQDSDLDTAEDMEFPFHRDQDSGRSTQVLTSHRCRSITRIFSQDKISPGSCPMMRCNTSSQGRPRLITGCRH